MARMQGKTTFGDYDYFAGIDVSKAHLDLALWPGGEGEGKGTRRARTTRFANDTEGIADMIAALGQPHLVVLEPTGRYHLAVWAALAGAGHGVAPTNPYRARRLAEGLGCLAKTDAVDARVLALIAARQRPEPVEPPRETALRIKELSSARAAMIRRRAAARCQMTAAGDPLVLSLLASEIAEAGGRIDQLDAALDALIDATPTMARTREILISIPGIAGASARTILADLPEIGRISDKEVAALTGTAPFNRESGQWKGASRTRGGRRNLRAALHMPAVVAGSRNPDLKAFRDRLKARGKNGHAITTATLRKLMVLANALVAQDRLWTPERP